MFDIFQVTLTPGSVLRLLGMTPARVTLVDPSLSGTTVPTSRLGFSATDVLGRGIQEYTPGSVTTWTGSRRRRGVGYLILRILDFDGCG